MNNETPNRGITSPRVRAWLYGIIAAAVPLLVVLDIFTPEVAGHVLAIAAAVLAVGGSALALVNTPHGETQAEHGHDVGPVE